MWRRCTATSAGAGQDQRRTSSGAVGRSSPVPGDRAARAMLINSAVVVAGAGSGAGFVLESRQGPGSRSWQVTLFGCDWAILGIGARPPPSLKPIDDACAIHAFDGAHGLGDA
jgi:hypothetical protein